MKTCECGCGQITKVSSQTRRERGTVKGVPQRFVTGHGSRTGKVKPGHYSATAVGGRRTKLTHVLIAERALGRPLPPRAQVHHVDGNSLNNAPSNLVICQDQAYHSLLHVRQRVLVAGGDPDTQRICADCKNLRSASDLIGGRFKSANHCKPCKMLRYKKGRKTAVAA